ncbi:MAG TPA: YqgE/AlgH family protein [Myxococcota bacterium]|nr:YqgE/AlgH family protein [Myxococcota bacterium]
MKNSIAPSILIAPPALLAPPFNESVIIIAGHQTNGSLGFMLNRPIGVTIRDLMEHGDDCDPIHTEKPVLFGGPVDKNSGFVMYEHEKNKPLAPGFMVAQGLSISPARKLLEEAASGNLPGRFDLMLGYASWNKGQLNRELSRGDWLQTSFSLELIFDTPPEERWLKAFEYLGIAPYAYMHVPGGAQA